MSKLRQGDILLFSTGDGGDIENINGEPTMDGGFESGAELTINESDGKPHWMDEYKTESEKSDSEFMNFIKGNLKTIKNLNQAVLLAEKDFAWFINDGIADTVNISIDDLSVNRIRLNVEILANGETLSENNFEINWGLQKAARE